MEVTTPGRPELERRKPGAATLTTTGLCKGNTATSHHWHMVMHATKLDQSSGVCKFFVSGKMIAVRMVPHGTPGGTAFRLTDAPGKRVPKVTFYLHGVFREHPELRPLTNCEVVVAKEEDVTGMPYLVINMQSQLATRTEPRESDASGEKKEETTAGRRKRARKTRKTA